MNMGFTKKQKRFVHFIFKKTISKCFADMDVWASCAYMPSETRRGFQISWDLWALETEPGLP